MRNFRIQLINHEQDSSVTTLLWEDGLLLGQVFHEEIDTYNEILHQLLVANRILATLKMPALTPDEIDRLLDEMNDV